MNLHTDIVDAPYAFPGGYPKYAVVADGGILCADCCKSEADTIEQATDDMAEDNQWRIVALQINYEDDLTCDHCYTPIERAYDDET